MGFKKLITVKRNQSPKTSNDFTFIGTFSLCNVNRVLVNDDPDFI